MVLNKQKGNMYNFVTHTWNAIKGKCPHDCSYCYMKRFPQGELRIDEKELKTNLGEGNFIFVGSSTDMFAEEVDSSWVTNTLLYCSRFNNTYLFQTKNPKRFKIFRKWFPKNRNVILGITIETNRETPSKADSTEKRIRDFSSEMLYGFRKMITIEPIMDFDVPSLVDMIKRVRPEFVNIGADSTRNNLPEPSEYKVQLLIKELEKFTKVNLKDNLKRIYSS